jgi:hypothetical protein
MIHTQQIGWAESMTGKAICIGEWGGHAVPGSKDLQWQQAWVDFLLSKCMNDNFMWYVHTSTSTSSDSSCSSVCVFVSIVKCIRMHSQISVMRAQCATTLSRAITQNVCCLCY